MNDELEQLYVLRSSIETPTFQEYFVKPVQNELELLKGAYDCDTLEEMKYLKGRKEGLEFFIRQLKIVTEDISLKERD